MVFIFNKRLSVSITLNKNKLKVAEKGSCDISCIPTINLLTKTEHDELIKCLNRASELLRTSYIRSQKHYK